MIFAAFYYFPVSGTLLKPLHDRHEVIEAEHTGLPHDEAGVPAELASVDAMVAEAKRIWAERDMAGEVGLLMIEHLGDANGYVSIYRAGSDRVALVGEGIHFKASTGEVLREEPPSDPVGAVNEFLTGLHLQHLNTGPCAGCTWLALAGLYLYCHRLCVFCRKAQAGARQTRVAGLPAGRCHGRDHGDRHGAGGGRHAGGQPLVA
ncbi:hypothetical protein ULF88_15175 [Halopseudomonas pachastrellae]|nr:hypothetical protein [Halopseudomonas pachastrellae]